ncbi:Crp/Fnr family transcriptional regulator [Kineothrix sp. MB12-C1]|uniref:Crp/Fnr family transcriptional regulator n=1 Tax=Kineothrix sp. MB12-C1 TaxID=3070215 RepID=UPI0027D2885F|nr:cyclic nucleotide-binding domain-containing protein [Kineothrix sp. MB12-C1]WMC93175.1 cyclic nucleotide-binding domain-containing protein [Kineothrix sp. MB12-C1]
MAKEFKRGDIICESGQPFNSLHMILKGTVRAVYSDGEFFLDKGDFIGLCELYYDTYIFTYIASDDVSIAPIPYKIGGLITLFGRQPDFAPLITSSCYKQMKNVLEIYEFSKYDCTNLYHYLTDSYNEYVKLSERHLISPRSLPDLETIEPLSLEEDIPQWLTDYYENMTSVIPQMLSSLKVPYFDYLNGLLMKTSQDIAEILSVCRMMYDYRADIAGLLMNKNRLDLFDLYTTLFFRIGHNEEDSTAISAAVGRMMINLEGFGSIRRDLYEDRVREYKETLLFMEEHGSETPLENPEVAKNAAAVANSLNIILEYAGCDAQVTTDFRKYIAEYKKQIDKNAADDDSRRLRLNITKLYYTIYTAAFQASLHDHSIPTILKMFFLFGYVDEELAGEENASYLYSIAESFTSSPENHVYTAYDWLKAIYRGEKEPSRNEFDMDYTAFVHEKKVTGKITAAQEAQLVKDKDKRVLFELENMFPLVNKITFGRITTFCPVFSDHNVLKDLSKSLVTPDQIVDAINKIRSIDFGAYGRETIYSNPEGGVAKEFVNVEVLPDVVLFPNVGIRGVMWQEIEGKRRTTPARFMSSIFQMEDLLTTLTRLTGEFRWEMCKRIQGARWNDLSERSLTSDYFDYIQFYKKNIDLTSEAKDKIKSAMQKAKNSYKEMFVRDYVIWVTFEADGVPRLNKVARNVLFTYCPFTKDIRERLRTNPLYKDILDRYTIRTSQKLHHMDNLYQKLQKSRLEVPEPIAEQRKFLES